MTAASRTVTYTFEDVVKALNAVEPYDWAAFLRDAAGFDGQAGALRWIAARRLQAGLYGHSKRIAEGARGSRASA